VLLTPSRHKFTLIERFLMNPQQHLIPGGYGQKETTQLTKEQFPDLELDTITAKLKEINKIANRPKAR
jgi:hypothetical protein